MIPLAWLVLPVYRYRQVLETPQRALPRPVMAVFLLYRIGFAPMGDGSVREADRTSLCVFRTSPAPAFESRVLSLAKRSNPA